ncbi:MAG: Copper homeostasis protein CutC [bacterium ADurb.Bin478]|nr:MAG: Copper homeostasis protein CutC [bacterium ADurb.Bin478]
MTAAKQIPGFYSPFLEVIACSLSDAVAAEQGGADRLELICRYDLGGLTPDFTLIDSVLRTVTIPVRVMLRDDPSFHVHRPTDRRELVNKAEQLAQRPLQGLVFGFLQQDGLDEVLLTEVLAAAAGRPVTFHRAFEQLVDPLHALSRLKAFPQIDRILTSGGDGDWTERLIRLQKWQTCGAPEIGILVGGGVTTEWMEKLVPMGFYEYHVGRMARQGESLQGPVQAERVVELKKVLHALCARHGVPLRA